MEDYTKKSRDGRCDIVSAWTRGTDSTDVVFKERIDDLRAFGIGFGYSFETGEWVAGHYGFKNEKEAIAYLKKTYGSAPQRVRAVAVYRDGPEK